MSVQRAASPPLHPLITECHQNNGMPAEVLERKVSALGWKAFSMNVLEKICYVAILAIMGVVLTISYASIVLTSPVSLLVAATALSTIPIAWALGKFRKLALQFSEQMQMEKGVLTHLRRIEQWTTPEIETFLTQHQLVPEKIPIQSLKALNPEAPLKTLLPLIARFNYLRDESNRIETKAQRTLPELEDSFRAQEEKTRQPIDPWLRQKIRFASQEIAWRLHEEKSVPLALQAALMLQILQDPFTQTSNQPTSTLCEIGGFAWCTPHTFAERVFKRTVPPESDEYVYFKDPKRPPLALRNIEDQLHSPEALRLLLYPPSPHHD